jgi:hypothetical protein
VVSECSAFLKNGTGRQNFWRKSFNIFKQIKALNARDDDANHELLHDSAPHHGHHQRELRQQDQW